MSNGPFGTPCPFNGAPTNLSLANNGISGQAANPIMWEALGRLMQCGLRRLVLQGSKLAGNPPTELPAAANDWLRTLDLSEADITGTLPPAWGRQLAEVREFRLSRNRMMGPIPDAPWAPMQRLQIFYLGANAVMGQGLTGTLPAWVGKLQDIRQINVKYNKITGTLPQGLCTPRPNVAGLAAMDAGGMMRGAVPALEVLHVSGNRMTGDVAESLKGCDRLISLDLADNEFTGPLPEPLDRWERMIKYDVAKNAFTGTIPAKVFTSPLLTLANFGNNRLTGTIPIEIASSGYLQAFTISNNMITGPIGDSIFFLPALERLLVDSNNLTSISQNVETALSLRDLVLSRNRQLKGTIPASLGHLVDLQTLEVEDTGMRGEDVDGRPDFPCFLKQTPSDMGALEHYTNMSCPDVIRLGSGSIGTPPDGWRCNYTPPYRVPVYPSIMIDPTYNDFYGCSCNDGFDMVSNGTLAPNGVMYRHCRPRPYQLPMSLKVAIIISSILGALLLAGLVAALTVSKQQMRRLQPRAMRRRAIMAKRARGPPDEEGAEATVVVTDIEGYSDLMKAVPELMTMALGMHNQAVRRAAFANAGAVLEQEGDSYTVMFHEPFDAVAFCLQTQLALQALEWPEGLPSPKSLARAAAAAAAPPPGAPLDPTGPPEAAAFSGGSGGDDGSTHGGVQGDLQVQGRQRSGSSHGLSALRLGAGRSRSRSTLAARTSNDGSAHAGEMGQAAIAHRQSNATRLRALLLSRIGSSKHRGLFNGLRVRMGVATGAIMKDAAYSHIVDMAKVVSDLASGGQVFVDAATFEDVKQRLSELGVVTAQGPDGAGADGGSAGAGCCGGPQGALRDAVALDMGEWKLPGLEPYPNQPPSPSGGRRTAAPGPGPVAEACGGSGGLAALLLQWRSGGGSGGGEPRGPPGPVAEAAGDAASAAGGPAALLPWHGGGPGDRIARGGGGGGALWLADEGAGGGGGGAAQAGRQGGLVDLGGEGGEGEQPRRDSDRTPGARRRTRSGSGGGGAALRVYQVLPPSLCQRAHVFGNRMALKDGATCLDLPYFDAPGTLHADLSASIALGDPKARGAQRQELPPMTTVFIAVEGAASFMRRHRKLAAQLHDQLCRVLQSALRCVPGGYVARVSGGDLKYLAAFYEAGDALQWCLLVQEAAMYAPWTAAVLRQSGFGEVVDPATGRILFRGPRLKMGVCEGRPRCVMPDHAGRADYHGATVNQAARYMDAAAHGGMIAAESGLLRSVFALWRGELPPEFTDVPEHSDVAAAAAAVQRSYAAAAAAAAPPAILSLDEGHEGAEADSDLEPDHNGAVEITVDGNEDEAAAAAAPPAAAAAAASAAGGRATPAASMLDRFLRSRGTGTLQVNASGGSGSTTASLASAVSPAFFGHRRSMQGPHRASAGGVSVSAALLADLTRPPASPLEAAAVSEMKMQLAQASAAAAAQMQAVASTAAAADGQSESSAGDQVSAGLTPPVIGSGSFSGVVPSVRVRTDLLQTSGPRFLCPEAFTKVPSDVIAVNIGRWKFKGSDATDMAYLADAHLAARPYPPGNPVGKGACVSPGDGSVLDSAAVQLPDLLARLRAEHWKSAGRFPPGPHHPFAPAPPAPGRPPAAALHHAQGAGGRLGSFTAGAANLSRLGSLLMRGGSGSGSGSGGGAQQGPPGERAGAAERERGGGLLRSLSPTSSSSGGGARPPVMRSYSAAPRLSAGFVRPDFGDLAGGGRGSPP